MTVLLFGCPRSGTSILGELFEHIPGYQFYFEPSLTRVQRLDHGSWDWALKNPIGPQPWTPGMACDLDDLFAAVPDPVSVFIVRHPLDAVCSLRPGMALGWNHGPPPPGSDNITDPLRRATAIWNWVNNEGHTNLTERQVPLLVTFEALVNDSDTEITRILEHCKIPVPATIGRYTSLISDRTGGYEAKHQDRWVTEDHDRRVGRWRNQITDAELAVTWAAVAATAARFGYEEPL